MTNFDGRAYLGASLVPPQLYHPEAPAVGDVGMQSMISAYMASRYRGQLVGQQTYPQRLRFETYRPSVRLTSNFDIAEFNNVHLPAHATHVGAEAWFAHTPGDEIAEAHHTIQVFDGVNTDTGTSVTQVLNEDNSVGIMWGLTVFRAECFVALSNVTAPDEAQIKVKAYADDATGGNARDYTPLFVTCWRWTS